MNTKKVIASALFLATLFTAPAAVLADNKADGIGMGSLGDTKWISTWFKTSTGLYYLEDHSRMTLFNYIATYNDNYGTFGRSVMTDPDNEWDSTTQRAGVDANFYAGKVYDWWKSVLGRNSYDNQGSSMYSLVHYASKTNSEAFFDGQYAVYGDGDGKMFGPLSSDFDIVALVWSQEMVSRISPLSYIGQSAALQNSWADAFAVSISSANWTIGETALTPGIPGDAMRSLANPSLYGQASSMSEYDSTGTAAYNSGIPNKAFYNFATTIGSRTIAAKVWYKAMQDYMTSTTTFLGARSATLSACAALYGSTSIYYTALRTAWNNVGVY